VNACRTIIRNCLKNFENNLKGKNMEYHHTQKGTVMLAFLLSACIVVVILPFLSIGNNYHIPVILLMPAIIMIAAALALFYALSVEIKDNKLIIYFGIGLIRKSILLSEIQQARAVQNPWYAGWGIRLIPGQGWLWNVSGIDAVELTMKNGDRFRIGTDEPEKLVTAIEAVIPIKSIS
jgi:hypothetical protein